jgi:pyrroloquinoline quinone biosynthesis protein B
LAAVFLTDANVDHCAGLLEFRQAGSWRVFSTKTVRDALVRCPVFRPFAAPPRSWETIDAGTVSIAGLRINTIHVDGLLPSFAGSTRTDGSTAAFAVEDGSGVRLVYAPTYLEASADLISAVDGATAAFLDGSFWTDDEMISLGLGTRTARDMGHAPVSGPGGSLESLRGARCASKYFTHINNSNPMLDPSSRAAARVAEEGFTIAEEGATHSLGATTARMDSHA